jgi:hypothetical protein
MRLIPVLLLAALPAAADSPDAWEDFRQTVATTCAALVQDPGTVTVEVNPFGSESYGAAIVTVTAAYGTDRMICIYDKQTGSAELTAAFTPAE